MKLMNEIESEFDGEIKEILVKDGESVEYGKPLFRISFQHLLLVVWFYHTPFWIPP